MTDCMKLTGMLVRATKLRGTATAFNWDEFREHVSSCDSCNPLFVDLMLEKPEEALEIAMRRAGEVLPEPPSPAGSARTYLRSMPRSVATGLALALAGCAAVSGVTAVAFLPQNPESVAMPYGERSMDAWREFQAYAPIAYGRFTQEEPEDRAVGLFRAAGSPVRWDLRIKDRFDRVAWSFTERHPDKTAEYARDRLGLSRVFAADVVPEPTGEKPRDEIVVILTRPKGEAAVPESSRSLVVLLKADGEILGEVDFPGSLAYFPSSVSFPPRAAGGAAIVLGGRLAATQEPCLLAITNPEKLAGGRVEVRPDSMDMDGVALVKFPALELGTWGFADVVRVRAFAQGSELRTEAWLEDDRIYFLKDYEFDGIRFGMKFDDYFKNNLGRPCSDTERQAVSKAVTLTRRIP